MSHHVNTVQNFLRALAFFITLIILSLFSFAFLGAMVMNENPLAIIIFIGSLIFNLWMARIVSQIFYILPEWERMVLLRLGKYSGTKGPGFFLIPPFIYSVANIVDTRITTHEVSATATLTKDNVPTKVTAAIEFNVENPQKAVISVKDFLSSVIWLSTEALKNTIGSMDLKELLGNREGLALNLQSQIDQSAQSYGVNVIAVRITDIDTPQSLIEELAVIARARRAAEAKKVQAQAEVLVAQQMAKASQILDENPGSYKLREIQNLAAMSKEESSMIIIYPSDSFNGMNIAAAATAQHQKKPTKVIKPPPTTIK